MNKVVIFAAILTAFVAILGDRPERKPGNLAPIQIISAVGAWALVLANASAIAIAVRDGSLILFCTAGATLAIALISFVRDGASNLPDGEPPESVKLVVDDLKRLFGGAPRLGMVSLEAVVVEGRCPGIGVTVGQQGRVVVRVRRDIARWLEGHQEAGRAGAAVIASFARFTVLHELGHVLNGDHRTFRFVRSVLIAHLVWIAGGVVAAASLVVNQGASATPLFVTASIVVLCVSQSLIARRFIAERERLADWRAMQTLAPADAARLLERRGRRRGVPNPTQLEKLMNDLKAQASPHTGRGLLSRVVAWVWPAGDDVHLRSESAGGDHSGGAPKPVLWAALLGMQCGLLSMSLGLASLLAIGPWIGPRPDLIEAVMLAMMTWPTAPAAMFCQVRIDPARLSVRAVSRTRTRLVVGLVFFLAFAAAALTLYRFQVRFGVAWVPAGWFFAFLVVAVGMLVGVSVWISGAIGGHDGGGELRTTPRSSWVQVFPLLSSLGLILIPLSMAAAHWLGVGSFRGYGWIAVAFLAFATFVVSTGMARSTSPALRVIAPMALLDTPSPVYGFRVFWRDFYVDLSRTTMPRSVAAAVAVQMVALPFFVLSAALVMQGLRVALGADTAVIVAMIGSFAVMALILVIPDRYRAYSGPSARLLDTSRLKVFERLLAVTRTAKPAAADRLSASIARWLRNDRFPDALLPEPRSVWPLEPLLSLVRLARAAEAAVVLERWRARIEYSLRQIVSNDAVAVAPGQQPSMHWTTLAAAIVDEAGLREEFPFERMLDRVETLLDERLEHGTANLLADVVAACRLLRRHGRRVPEQQRFRRLVRASSLVRHPLLRQSLAELCELADLTGDSELRERLGSIVRSRTWEGLQLNPRKEVLLLLDCYLAAVCLGELDEHHAAAGVIAGELAERVSDELTAVVNG